ncbi:Lrp/AsnC family transcriptional regulator [Streptomyces sp. NPDC018833]|uniref:Lrp/AsnC family transcriptional regulator n=1 Tax=Streptomyces sp. NPDC018833 TaxID=3365053 RepID=UPI00378A2D9F
MSTPETPTDVHYRLAALERLDQLIKNLSAQRAELARGPFQVEGSARIQAVVPVQAALLYAREATEEVVGGLHAYARQFCVEAVAQAALSGEDLVAEDREELRETSALLLGDILIVGQLLTSSGCCRGYRRLDRLVATGAIRGFTALVDPQALAWHTEAFVEVYCAGNPTPAQLRQALEDVPEVVEACTVSGAADAVLHMLARDITHLELAIQRARATAPVDRTESVIVLSRLLNRPRL